MKHVISPVGGEIAAFAFLLVGLCLFSLTGLSAQTRTRAIVPYSYKSVRQLFLNPPSEFRSAPLWVWNNQVTKRHIEEQLKDFRDRGIGGVFIHPRPGLITEYLSDEWFALCRHAVDEGKKLGMKVWIYDENSYPSGFAGGHVPAQMPDAVRSGLSMNRLSALPSSWEIEPLVVLQKSGATFVDITSDLKSKSFETGDFYVFTVVKQKPNPWYGGFTYVDLMRRDVTEKFLDVTMNAYKRAIGDQFGKVVPGVFQDEAEVNPATVPNLPSVSYTRALFKAFQSRWGYDLRLHLPSLYEDVGEWHRVRHNYYSAILDLFIEGWAKPYYEYCERNNLIFTGHYWEHEWPRPVFNPDNLALAGWAHMPGIDILMNEFNMDTHAQFGNARAVKEIRSAANQLGRSRTMSETFGAGGWEMTFFDQKRIADWEYVLGVNFVNQHLSYMTIMGARKTDHPLSFSYHEPWWENYNVLADYFGRLSVALSLGEQTNRILVIEPTTTAWMHYASKGDRAKFQNIERGFQSFVNRLESAQIEYDLGSERTIQEHGKVSGKRFVVGVRSYDLVILPPTLENLDKATVSLLDEYLAARGKVLCYGKPPTFLDGKQSDEIVKMSQLYSLNMKRPAAISDNLSGQLSETLPANWITVSDESDISKINELAPSPLRFRVASPGDSLLFHHRRTFEDFELVFLVNTSDKSPVTGAIEADGSSCEVWDGFTGAVKPCPAITMGKRISIDFTIPRGGSLLLCLRQTPGMSIPRAPSERMTIPSVTGLSAKRMSKNILTLDYCDLTVGGQTEKDLYFYQAQTKIYQHHGLPVNPWDHAVQYKKNIVERDTFSANTGFEATFTFTIASGVTKETIQAVVERPELFKVFVNGTATQPLNNEWWLDKAFGVFDIGRWLVDGENRIVLKSSPFTIHTELQPVFILGDFCLEAKEKGFAIVPASPLNGGSWALQGLPFYGGAVEYSRQYRFEASALKGHRAFVGLKNWSGVVAEVRVNGKKAGVIGFEPFELDVTKRLKPGLNDVSVVVYGSLKNTLGPHHNDPPLGRAWPGAFQQGAKEGYPPGARYHVVGYGLIDEFDLQLEQN